MRFLLLILCFCASLRAEWDQLFSEDEDPTLYHYVNVITGNLNLCIEDGVIQGAKPLPIFRTYSSAGALESRDVNADLQLERESWLFQGGWNFLPHANLWIDLSIKSEYFKIYLAEPSGNLVSYSYSHAKNDHTLIFKPGTDFGQYSGALSGKHAIQNHVLELHQKSGTAILYLPDGGSRFYKGHDLRHWGRIHWRRKRNEQRSKYYYRLMKEVLPSRHEIHYSYDEKRHLVHVAVKNPSGTKTLSWMHIDRIKKSSPFMLGIRTSDKKSLQYKTVEYKEVDYLCGVQSNHKPEERTGMDEARFGIGARLNWMDLGNKNQFIAKYYTPSGKKQEKQWKEKPEKKDFSADKVRLLEAPIESNGERIPFAQFSYQPGVTDVRDTGQRLTRYRHVEGHLTAIEHYNEKNEAVSSIRFLWEKGRMKAKAMLDAQGNAHFSKIFQYDEAGNVTAETLWGALSGTVEGPFHLNDNGSLAGAESYSKRYVYLAQFNIPILEEEENGLAYVYAYKPDTDLLTAKLTHYESQILLREFYIYDEDNLLITEIIDDGNTPDLNDLSCVTERHVKHYHRNPTSARIEAMTEAYWDPVSQTEKQLRTITYAYSAEEHVIAEDVADAKGEHRYTIATDYDAHGHVTRKTTPLGQENHYAYDGLGKLLSAKEVGSLKKTFIYDAAGRPACVEESDALGVVKTTWTAHDAQGNLLSQTDAKGNTTGQCYDAFGHCIQTQFPWAVDQNGADYLPVVSFEYDIQGNLACTSVLGGGTTHTAYNTLRKPVRIVRADGTSLRHRYSNNGVLTQTIEPDGTRTDYCYDMFQRMTSKKTYSADGNILSTESWTYNTFHLLAHTDPNGLKIHYAYDPAGRKVSEQAESKVITYAYDALGFLEKAAEAECTHVQLHDVAGRVIEEWEETSDGHVENHMWFSYDEENRKTKAVRVTSVGEATDLFLYDRESRLTAHTDPLHNTTQFLYGETENTLGQRVLQKTTIDALGNQMIETHDAQNRCVSRLKKDPQRNNVAAEEFFYDKAGNQARRVSTVYHQQATKNQICVRWEYDSMGRVIEEREGSDKTTRFAYDGKGRLHHRLNPNGVSLDYTYDGLDRLVEIKSSDDTIHYKYLYGSGPDPIEVFDSILGFRLQREYNTFGQMIKEINPYGLTFTWEYDQHGRTTRYTLPDRSSVAYSYSAGHLATVSRLSSKGQLLYTHRYLAYNPNGQIEKEECIHPLSVRQTTYDLLERPARAQLPFFQQSIDYGPSGLVTTTSNTLFGTKTYAHDPLNQLTQEAEQNYAFDSLGNPLDCSVNDTNQILSGPDYRLEYDPNGNPIRRITAEGITEYTYDALNRLTRIIYPSAIQTHYIYDALSRLIVEHNHYTQHFFLYDKSHEVGAMDSQGTLLEFKALNPEKESPTPLAIEIGKTTYVPLIDFQENTIALVSSEQNIVEAYPIDSFGTEHTETSPLNPWRFASKRALEGLIYFGHRFYDPHLKRWLTPDPSGFADGSNLYAYALNSPLNRLDLFGLDSDPRFSPDLRIEAPLRLLIPAQIFRTHMLLPCKGFVDNVPVNWVVSCGHWNKLQFTQDEWKKGTVNIADHFQELVPHEGRTIGLLTGQNGICTSPYGLRQNMLSTTKMVPEGTLTIALYNPTEGPFRDCIRFCRQSAGKDTPTVVTTRQFLIAVSDNLYKINSQLLWLHIAHSEAGLIYNNACKGMTPDQQSKLNQQINVFGLGPGEPVPLEFGYETRNVYSNQDFFTMWFALKHRNNPKYDIRFVPCRSKWSERTGYIADHAFLGGTYQSEQMKYIRELRKTYGFYGTKNSSFTLNKN